MKILQAQLIRYPYFIQSFLEKKTMTKVLRQQAQWLSSIYANCWSSAQAYNIMYAAPGGLEQPGGGIMQ